MNERLEVCAICGEDGFKPLRGPGLEACAACGHVRLAFRGRDPEQLQRDYFDEAFAERTDFFTRFYAGLTARRRLRELPPLPAGTRALEVGVGGCALLLALRDAGCAVRGVDLSAPVCERARSRHGLEVRCGTLEDYAADAPSAFDLLFLCHVLEHVRRPADYLRAARRVLAPAALLYLAVPNIDAWEARLPGWTGYQPYHLHYFNARNLRRLLDAAGFEVLEERTFEPLTGWTNALVGTLRGAAAAGGKAAAPRGALWTAYNAARIAAGLVSSPLRWLQARAGRGEELVLLARPR
ncbi:MAG TPA: class I SAM-dependent methyltransferase [Elusimicrobiota bacterium]|jgi:SAM-dependent methyltransferase|nr:class I SAM-dependent methyltransferase [Elusimicrobiota bacterium]